MGKTQKNKKPRENQQKTIFGDSLGKLYWQNQKNSRKPKNQKTKTFQRMFGLRLMFVFLVLPRFFCFFGLDLEKTKKTQGFFVFLDKMMVKELWKTKKTQVFFGFWVFVALVSFWLRNEKPKKPWVFLVFSRSRPKKTKKPRQNQKNQTWASDQTFSEKFCFFVFWFSRGFGYSVFPKIQPKSRKL